MALIVQDDTGLVTDANSYITVSELDTYCDNRGYDISSYTNDEKEDACVKGTDYLDRRFRFAGRKLAGRRQNTQWPRTNAYDSDGYYISDIPTEVKEACLEYTRRALAAALLPDPSRDDTGRTVSSKSEKVGPLEESTTYSSFYTNPEYPEADQILARAGLIMSNLTMCSVRG